MSTAENVDTRKLRVAEMVQSGESQDSAIEVVPGIWESRGIGNSYLITTPEGNVLINAGTLRDARRGLDRFSNISNLPIKSIILTQSHANQYGGLEIYKTDSNSVIAHHLHVEERETCKLLFSHYSRGSRRIFGTITGPTEDMLPTKEITPDTLIGDDGHRFTLGDRRFEIIWTPGGETRSAVIIWLPDEKVAIVGNLFGPLFGNHPNLNTLRGDRPRSAIEFIKSAGIVQKLGPRTILTGHEKIEGEEHITKELKKLINAMTWVHDRTVEGMNSGYDVRTLMRTIELPSELKLTEEYGKLSWNVRAIWHEYTGWFDASRGTTELYGVPASTVATDIAELAGGVEHLVARAEFHLDAERPLEALHILDIAKNADPDMLIVKHAMRRALILLDQQTSGKNLWEKRWIASELQLLENPVSR